MDDSAQCDFRSNHSDRQCAQLKRTAKCDDIKHLIGRCGHRRLASMITVTVVKTSLTVLLVAAAVYTDVRWGKIFNYLTGPAIALGLIINSLSGIDGFLHSIEGVGLAFGLFLISSLLGRILGGGDIKLLTAIGALQGPVFLAWTICGTAIIGGVLAVIIALRYGILLEKLKTLFATCYMRVTFQVPMEMEDNKATEPRLPYAIAIGLGTIATIARLQLHIL